MNKAFIFDMDGVIVDSEKTWLEYENNLLEKILGNEIVDKIGDTVGWVKSFRYKLELRVQGLVKDVRIFYAQNGEFYIPMFA